MKKPIALISLIAFILVITLVIILRPLWRPLFFGESNSQTQTYREPHTYAITYPKGWRRYGNGEKTGYEIFSVYSYNFRKVTDPGSKFSGGQIKIALSILDLPSTLAEIVKSEFTGTEKNYTQKTLTINGQRAIRVTAVLENDDSVSPVIVTFIEYKQHQYAHLIGYYDGAGAAVQEIIKIQDSFQALD